MTGRRGRTLLAVTVAAVVLLAVGLALRPDGGSTPAAAGRTAAPTPALPADAPAVIVPGRPGEPAATRPAQDVRDTGAPRYNTLDVWFVRMMIPHHQQALAVGRARPRPGRRAPRSRPSPPGSGRAQGPEIGLLRGWLDARGLAAEVRRPRPRPACRACSPPRRSGSSPPPGAPTSTGSSSS